MKRIVLFVLTNIAVLVVLNITLRLLGVDRILTENGINFGALLVFSMVVGFAGSIISLLISKQAAKWSTGAQLIDGTESSDARWIVETVRKLAEKAGIAMPEVAIYDGPPNAFATGPTRNNSLVAVSTGLLQSMNREEVEAVLGHEVAHVANGDMVTMTLIQGVVNTFVIFLSRIVGYFVDRAVFRNERGGEGPGFFITVLVCQIVFGLLASIIVAWFSRQREFRADAGSASYLGTPRPMMNALARLGGIEPEPLPEGVRALGITDKKGFMALFSTHPPMEERIARLRGAQG
jgi:heat shock protein HtpX